MKQKLSVFTETIKANNELLSSSFVSDLTLSKAIEGNQISFVKTESGEMVTVALISKLIGEVCKYVNTSMDAGTIMMSSRMILQKYWYLKMEEIMLIFRDGVFGKYGKIYGQLTFSTLAEWIEKHDEERGIYFENNHLTNKSNLNGSDHNRTNEPTLTNMFQDMVNDEANRKVNFILKKRED